MKSQLQFFSLLFFVNTLCFASTDSLTLSGTMVVESDTIALSDLPSCSPEQVGMSSKVLSRIDSIANNAISLRVFPGCQVLVVKEGKMVYDKSFGKFTYETDSPRVGSATLYDLASLSKTTGTLWAIMKLYDQGKLKLTDSISEYLPFLHGTNKAQITIEELLFHESGLPAGLPFSDLAIEKIPDSVTVDSVVDTTNHVKLPSPTRRYKFGWVSKVSSEEFPYQVADSFFVNVRFHEAAMNLIAKTRVGTKTYLYSCINFILLKEIAETISGMKLDLFLESEIFEPMQLSNLCYLPLRTHTKDQIAPTLKKDFLRNGEIRGFVHDPDAAFLGNVSGNAGLFANSHDVARVYQMLLNGGKLNGQRYLSEETVRLFTTQTSKSGRRGLGFDKPVPSQPGKNPCSALASPESYGHTGYTGTCCWVDPKEKLIYVFLSNRTYPDDGVNKLAKLGIRPKIQEVIYKSIKTK